MDNDALGRKLAALEVYAEDTRRELEIRVEAAAKIHEEQQRALQVAADNNNRRLESMNEFREQLNEQTKTFMTREAAQLLWANHDKGADRTEERLRANEQAIANLTGKLVVVGVVMTALLGLLSVGLRLL